MKHDLVLVSLNEDQISKAKDANGKRRQITHALVCGNHGIRYGTEKQCKKYYSAWKDIFKHLFGECYETGEYKLSTYTCAGNVVMELIAESDNMEEQAKATLILTKSRKKGLLARLFGV